MPCNLEGGALGAISAMDFEQTNTQSVVTISSRKDLLTHPMAIWCTEKEMTHSLPKYVSLIVVAHSRNDTYFAKVCVTECGGTPSE